MNGNNRIESIQGLRVFLFLGIFLFHCGISAFRLGWGGVQCFLVVTAFLLTRKWLSKDRATINPINQIWHRVKRLYPPYLLLVVVAAIGYVALKHHLPDDLFYYFFSAQNFYWIHTQYTSDLIPFTAHLWYIPLDVYLFILWILVLRYCKRNSIKTISIAAIIIGTLYRVVCVLLSDNVFLAYINPIGQIDSFGFGSLLAVTFNEKTIEVKEKIEAQWLVPFLLGVIGVAACVIYKDSNGVGNWASHPFVVNIYLFMALLSYGSLRATLIWRPLARLLSNNILAMLGAWTYVLYIVHWPIIQVARHFVSNSWIVAFIALPATMACTFIWQRFIEPRLV